MSWLLLAELVIIAGSYVEARIRRSGWFYRWVWWHLVVLWFSWLLTTRLLLDIAEPVLRREARKAVERYRWSEQAARNRTQLALPTD